MGYILIQCNFRNMLLDSFSDPLEKSRLEENREPFEESPPCHSAQQARDCHALVDCSWCGNPLVKYSYDCFEASLWKCPKRPECQRAREELWGFRVGTPSALVAIVSILCFVLTALLFKRRCADRPWRKLIKRREILRQRREALRTMSSSSIGTPNEIFVVDDSDFEYALLNHEDVPPPTLSLISMDPIPSPSQRIVTHVNRHMSRFLLVFATAVCLLCVLALAISPTGPEFTVCDIRWDIGSIQPNGKRDENKEVHILAELSVSIWNPDRFDLDLAEAKGEIHFHDGVLARFHWEPRGGMVRVSSGHVYDMRVVISVDWIALQQIPNLLIDWASVEGIVFSLDASAFVSLRILGIDTPRLSVGANDILIPLNDANRNLCRCTI